jgi:Xaa-Pro aminopeptidase
MTYKGDEHLKNLLAVAGEKRSLAEVKETLKGINAAPADLGEPLRWVKLFSTGGSAEIIQQLSALKEQLAANQNNVQQNKLADLRAEMAARDVEGFFIPRADEFQGEYVPSRY